MPKPVATRTFKSGCSKVFVYLCALFLMVMVARITWYYAHVLIYPFNRAGWTSKMDWANKPTIRQQMLPALKRYKLVGIQRNELELLLGSPDGYREAETGGCVLTYGLGSTREYFTFNSVEFLEFHVDATGNVVRYQMGYD